MSDERPEGWTKAKLSELLIGGVFTDGDWVESKDQDPNGGVRLIQLADVGDGEYRDRSARFLTSEKARELRCTFLKPGDLLVARMPDPLGRACVFPGDSKPAVTVVDVCVIRAVTDGPISSRWLMHALNAPQTRMAMAEHERGSTRKRISRGNLGNIELPLPPLAEQSRIAASVDGLIAEAERAKARLDRVTKLLKRAEEALLNTACSGELSDNWRASTSAGVHQSERHPDSLQREGEAPFAGELPSTWQVKRLEDLSERVSVGHVGPTTKFYCGPEDGVPFVRSQNVRPGRLDMTNPEYITPEFHASLKKSQLKSGDILVVRVGANRGDVCAVPPGARELNCANIVFARPKSGLTSWVELYCNSPGGRKQLLEMTTGSAQGVLNTKAVADLLVPIPPEEERAYILQRVAQVRGLIRQAQKRVAVAAARADKLPQSILAKAFSGELVPTEAELARAEGRPYESAAALLQRLSSTPDSAPPKRPRASRKKG